MERAAWAEAVFHVLAHLDVGARAASCHDTAYIAWARDALGPPEARTLAEDAAMLRSLLGDALAPAQLLAWTQPAIDQDLTDPMLVALGPAAEILRAAAELELPLLAKAPWPPSGEWPDLTAAAPALARCTVAHVRSLPRRGRVHDARIFVGVPGIAGAGAEHLAWQAAHEATVFEVGSELRALGLLRARAARAGLGERHARWLATVDHGALGPIPDVTDLGDRAPGHDPIE